MLAPIFLISVDLVFLALEASFTGAGVVFLFEVRRPIGRWVAIVAGSRPPAARLAVRIHAPGLSLK
jgi:hypothetical protein